MRKGFVLPWKRKKRCGEMGINRGKAGKGGREGEGKNGKGKRCGAGDGPGERKEESVLLS